MLHRLSCSTVSAMNEIFIYYQNLLDVPLLRRAVHNYLSLKQIDFC